MLAVDAIDTFYGPSHVLQGVSLTVDEGEIVCLLGRNGAGKTTTLRSIIGLVPPRSGSITFDGKKVTGQPPYAIARLGIGYVDQDRRIFPDLTVDDNLEVAASAHPEGQWAKQEIYQTFPELAERKSQEGRSLSGGEQQMLAIARALIANPRLMLLDEPSEGLAPLIVKRLEQLIRDITQKGVAVFLAEQNIRFAMKLAKRGYIIDKGRIRHQGNMEALQDEDIVARHLSV